MKMEQIQCSETSAIKHHTTKNNPEDYTQHSQHGEILKSRKKLLLLLSAIAGMLTVVSRLLIQGAGTLLSVTQ
jgi:hypothetical protein